MSYLFLKFPGPHISEKLEIFFNAPCPRRRTPTTPRTPRELPHFKKAMARPSPLSNSNLSGVPIIYKASCDGPFLACPGSVTQTPLQHFVAPAHRQLGLRKLDATRNFAIAEGSSPLRNELVLT